MRWVAGVLSKRSPRNIELPGASANAERPASLPLYTSLIDFQGGVAGD